MHTFIKRTITGIFLLISFLGIFFYASPIVFGLILVAIQAIIIAYELPQLVIPVNSKNKFGKTLNTVLYNNGVVLYATLPFAFMLLLNADYYYRILLCIAFLAAAAFDTGAYCAGNLWGRHPIAPSISPAKTIEGLIGGYASCFLFLWIVTQQLLQNNTSLLALLVLTLFFGSLAFVGDLFESVLKRHAKIKDSGSLLPGHGGLLDRLDSSMATTLGIYLAKVYVIQFFR